MTITLAHGQTYNATSRPALSLAEWLATRPNAASDTLAARRT